MKVAARQTAKARTRKNKTIPLSSSQTRAQLDETGKLSIVQCKAILCKDGAVYSDEEVAIIRQTLYALAEVDYKYHQRKKQQQEQEQHAATIIPLHKADNEQQNSYSLHPRIYRRTG